MLQFHPNYYHSSFCLGERVGNSSQGSSVPTVNYVGGQAPAGLSLPTDQVEVGVRGSRHGWGIC
jgi:hypothetical protein